jgi:hypothetical protein
MSDIIDINVAQTVEEVTINVTEEVIQVNINTINGGGGIESVVAGDNISVDNTDPNNPIVSATGLVPYVGATSDVNLGEFGMLTGNLEFDNTPTNLPTAAGSVYWNDSDGTLDLILKGGNVKLQVGQESVIRVVNKTATNINLLESNYQAVRVTGAQGQRLKVDLAQATTDNLSAETIGLVTETINNNQEGFITTSGLVRNINTTGSLQGETWADGDIVYLSPTVAGRITKVKPVAPNHLVIIGYVISAHATQGSIFVKVDNGYELDELHNVKIDTPLNNQGLVYNSTLEVWENKAINLQRVLEAGGTSNNGEILLSYTGSDYRMFINGDQLLSYDITTNESISIIPPFITVNGTSNNLLIKPSKFEFLQGAFKTEITRVTPTANRVITFKDETGTVAFTSDIPSPITIDATPTDGSSNAVSSNGVFDALALKQTDIDTRTKILYQSTTPSSAVTGTTAETEVLKITIPANTLSANGFLQIPSLTLSKSTSGTAGTCRIRIKLSTSSTMPSTTTDQIGTFLSAASFTFLQMKRTFSINDGNLSGFAFGPSLVQDNTVEANIFQSREIDVTQTLYLYVSVANTSTADTTILRSYIITN